MSIHRHYIYFNKFDFTHTLKDTNKEASMGKKSNLIHQYKKQLNSQCRFSESKHLLKQSNREKAKLSNTPYEQVKGIFSTTTLKNYDDVCAQYVKFLINEHPKEIRSFEDGRKFVSEFLQSKLDGKSSAWTLHMYGTALACAYNCTKDTFGFTFPLRERKNIIRCRGENGSDFRNTNPRFNDIKDFIRGAGARRQGLLRLTKDDLRQRSDGLYEIHLREKNNMERWALVLPQYQEHVIKMFNDSKGYNVANEVRLFRKCDIPVSSIHDLRAEYASSLYSYFEEHGYTSGKTYFCRNELYGITYDKGILAAVSINLGHHRLRCCGEQLPLQIVTEVVK